MDAYRIYRIASGGRLELGETFSAAGDEAAVETARRLADGEAVELWQAGRLVGRLPKLGAFTRPSVI